MAFDIKIQYCVVLFVFATPLGASFLKGEESKIFDIILDTLGLLIQVPRLVRSKK